ncbi:NAD(P)H-dependent flavin oxidoreductase [Pseudooceanicola sp. C21-150M6]|uniref:NAD(P)H-dependent flavin oxidoreductase n=1 Tax=Pseudooceanicola sp. C21-150M6 TaxID=3434355 RepID=UPI003D7F892E
MDFLSTLGLSVPVIQAPMAGVSTPELAAAVSNSGALGSIGIGATDTEGARSMITDLRARTTAPFNVNVFVHADPTPDDAISAAWCEALRPLFGTYGATPPDALHVIYKSFAGNEPLIRLLVHLAPPVVSFHFGLPDQDTIEALRQAGCLLLLTATNLEEARAAERAGMTAIVAQGYEAGGHRGMFDPSARDERLPTAALTRQLVLETALPVIAAGGIMDGAGIRAALDLGAVAAQLGTAFVACPESAADAGYRAALGRAAQTGTVMTDRLSGRPARCLVNRMTSWADSHTAIPAPPYPIAYDAAKALNAAAKAAGEYGFGAQWAGQAAARIRPMPAADLVALLRSELAAAS